MFEDDDPNAPPTREEADQRADDQFFAALTLLGLALLGGVLWAYLVLTEGVYGPGL